MFFHCLLSNLVSRGLHYWWVALHLESSMPDVAGQFLEACIKHCISALEFSPGSLKPVMLWARVLQVLHQSGGRHQVPQDRFEQHLEQFCGAFEMMAKVESFLLRLCSKLLILLCFLFLLKKKKVRPLDTDLTLLRQLAEIQPELSVSSKRSLGRCFKGVCGNSSSRSVVRWERERKK